VTGTEVGPAGPGRTSPTQRRFTATLTTDHQGRTHVPIPFDPNEVWGRKTRHHVAGVIEGRRFRGVIDGVIDDAGHERVLILGPAWNPEARVSSPRRAEVLIEAEGPQRGGLAPDVAAALDAAPAAGAFFDSLAQFYRKAYLSWVDATKRRPEQRPVRIAEMVRLLADGKKQRPTP
jgi:Bacteriocin-protection, YdeI or OmpD-Associated